METTDEQWRTIPGYEGYYEVSDRGRVRRLPRRVVFHPDGRSRLTPGGVLKSQFRPNTGYLMVHLSKQGARRGIYVHRLVLLAFHGEPADGMEACHNNDIRTDNRLENLRWDTHTANVGDAIARGRHRSHNAEKTRCHRDHPFDEKNTLVRPEGRGCRECIRFNERARYRRAKCVGTPTQTRRSDERDAV